MAVQTDLFATIHIAVVIVVIYTGASTGIAVDATAYGLRLHDASPHHR